MATAKAKTPSKSTTVLEFDMDAIKRREKEVAKESDESILERLSERFEILDEMTKAVKEGNVRAMIVSGPPGVGKSFGVEKVLQKADLFNTLAERKPKFEVVKGAMSSIGLYAKLYEFAAEGNVVVFDDCDSILMEDLSLNILKGALDSSERRFISWNTDSRLLRSEGIPDRFEFKGAAAVRLAVGRRRLFQTHCAATARRASSAIARSRRVRTVTLACTRRTAASTVKHARQPRGQRGTVVAHRGRNRQVIDGGDRARVRRRHSHAGRARHRWASHMARMGGRRVRFAHLFHHYDSYEAPVIN